MPPDRTRINALMDLASAGDQETFGLLASAVQDELFRLALAHGLRRDDAAEATQETLLRAYAGRRKWNRGGDAMAWLCGILVNVARDSSSEAGGASMLGFGADDFKRVSYPWPSASPPGSSKNCVV